MTLAELEMFINNMIDTSMSYKDTNGTKYTNEDKVSGFNKITSESFDNSTYNYIYDKYFGPNNSVEYYDYKYDFWGNRCMIREFNVGRDEGDPSMDKMHTPHLYYKEDIQSNVMPSAYKIKTFNELNNYIRDYFNNMSFEKVSGTRGYRWNTNGGLTFEIWETYDGYEYPARWESWASNSTVINTLLRNWDWFYETERFLSGKPLWDKDIDPNKQYSMYNDFRLELNKNIAKIDKMSIINYRNDNPYNNDIFPVEDSAVVPEYKDWLYEWARSIHITVIEKHSFMDALKNELSATFGPIKNKAIQIASSIQGNESFGHKIQKIHNIITQEHDNAVVKAKALELLLGKRI